MLAGKSGGGGPVYVDEVGQKGRKIDRDPRR
jgi:hypothetical protein